jgi:hypothetical protein
MSRLRRYQLLGTTVVALAGLVGCASASGGSGPGSAGSGATECQPLEPFRAGNFSHPLQIDNPYLPMSPGDRRVYVGEDSEGRHSVVTAVTGLVKEVDGITARVIYERDLEDGVVTEAELALFAQDDAGNVWEFGELPEDFEDGTFAGAPDVWLSGELGAEPGIQMPAKPETIQGTSYLQGKAPDIDFLDCATVASSGGTVTVPAGSFSNVVMTHETSPLENTKAIQTKEVAPGVGVVRVGAIHDPEAETMVLTENAKDTGDALAQTNKAAADLDAHGHSDGVSKLYAGSPPVHAG